MDKKRFAKITLIAVSFLFAILSAMHAYAIVQVYDIPDLLNKLPTDDLTQQEKETVGTFILELIFIPIMIWNGVNMLKEISKSQYDQSVHYRENRGVNSRQRKLAYFHTQLSFYLLIIALLISFMVQSMSEERNQWMYFWGMLVIIGVVLIKRYRDKKLGEIFDDEYYS